jgi:hypothetical protein
MTGAEVEHPIADICHARRIAVCGDLHAFQNQRRGWPPVRDIVSSDDRVSDSGRPSESTDQRRGGHLVEPGVQGHAHPCSRNHFIVRSAPAIGCAVSA